MAGKWKKSGRHKLPGIFVYFEIKAGHATMQSYKFGNK